jgi:ribonuclease HI
MKPAPAEVLRFLAEHEPLETTLARFPGLTRDDLRRLLEAVAAAAGSVRFPEPPRPRAEAARGGDVTRVRVYSDGAARGNPGPAGAGAVIYDAAGNVVEELGKYLGVNTNNFAEYMGLLIGLRRARELGAREVEVFADSELMIRQLSGRYKVKAENLKDLHRQAVALLAGFERVKLAHVPRTMNAHADEMSNRAIDERM